MARVLAARVGAAVSGQVVSGRGRPATLRLPWLSLGFGTTQEHEMMMAPRACTWGHHHRLVEQERGFYGQGPFHHATLLQFCDVPPAGFEPALCQSGPNRTSRHRTLCRYRIESIRDMTGCYCRSVVQWFDTELQKAGSSGRSLPRWFLCVADLGTCGVVVIGEPLKDVEDGVCLERGQSSALFAVDDRDLELDVGSLLVHGLNGANGIRGLHHPGEWSPARRRDR
ncbi:hypothetical protein AB0I61_31030 [Polymorphospora rubra]|uniref:hypothetical protein n=1 Tax=Polymorphospora rubra TaxID=338584 RepID=UPI0033FFD0F2